MKITKVYAKFVFLFVLMSALLLLFIVYLSFAKTTVIVHPRLESFTQEFTLQVSSPKETDDISSLSAQFLQYTVRGSKRVVDLTQTSEISEKATGEVTIFNKYRQSQPLVATTRFLSNEGILFRTLETVTVPAGGQVKVNVIADQPGASGEIPPTHFTIVALWKGLQDLIYAESNQPMKRSSRSITVVTQEDIRNALEELSASLIQEALTALALQARNDFPHLDFLPDAFEERMLFESSSVPAGIEASEFTVERELQIIAIVTSKKLLETKIQEILQSALPENKKFAPSGKQVSTYSLIEVELEKHTGKLVGRAEYPIVLSLSHPVLDRSKLTNKDAQEIRAFLTSFPEISDVQVKFSPFWSKRSLPLEDHIEIFLSAL